MTETIPKIIAYLSPVHGLAHLFGGQSYRITSQVHGEVGHTRAHVS